MGILLQPVQARRQGLAIPLTSIGQEEQLEVMWSAWPHDCAFLAILPIGQEGQLKLTTVTWDAWAEVEDAIATQERVFQIF